VKIDHCIFPEGLLYDLENFVWVKEDDPGSSTTTAKPRRYTIGITPILASVAGKFSQIKLKPVGSEIEKGRSFGSVESPIFFGVARCPFPGKIIQVNENLRENPKLANDFPYDDGWLARIETTGHDMRELNNLKGVEDSQEEIKSIMEKLHVRCFAAFPDHQMFEIGVECAATLTKLGELISKIPQGEVVHLVSDDLSADFEMIRWSEETGQKLLETRREGNLFHFIVKKVK
jgi:glycine cleavage system H protein